ncbi:MAG: DUF4297 domain-containing protein [Methylocystaceae bacterium]|nr:DUF4297 domain-containing protein [Methylocystaceae bacterium]
MSKLMSDLLFNVEREIAGSRSTERLDFQACWGIDHLIDLHSSTENYAVAFEFHDDIFVIDNVSEPTKVRFFQVKTTTKAKAWSINEITRQPKSSKTVKNSHAGKLLINLRKFPEHTDQLGFVSNQFFDFAKIEELPCTLREISADKFDNFLSRLKEEFPDANETEAELFQFHQTKFTPNGADEYIRGKIATFIDEYCGDIETNHSSFYFLLLDQCRKRSKKLADVSSFEQLLQSKFVTREQIEKWLEAVRDKAKKVSNWDAVSQELRGQLSATKRAQLKRKWFEYEADRWNIGNAALVTIRNQIQKEIDTLLLSGEEYDLLQVQEKILPRAIQLADEMSLYQDEDYFKALVLYEFSVFL